MTHFGKGATDFIAPAMADFNAAEIPDMSSAFDQQDYWLANYFLNTVHRGRLRAPDRQRIFNFLRRAQQAFQAYDVARTATYDFLVDPGVRPMRYVVAVGHWEDHLAYAWQALRYLSPSVKAWYERGDGSDVERLNLMHNDSKHGEQRIEDGYGETDGALTIWLTNTGLSSKSVSLTYEQVSTTLRDLGRLADACQDPVAMHDKLGSAL